MPQVLNERLEYLRQVDKSRNGRHEENGPRSEPGCQRKYQQTIRKVTYTQFLQGTLSCAYPYIRQMTKFTHWLVDKGIILEGVRVFESQLTADVPSFIVLWIQEQ